MRPLVQSLVASAVVGAAAALAATPPDHPTADLGRAVRANLTHRWTVAGRGGGTTSFAVVRGDCFYAPTSFHAYVDVTRTRPAPGAATDGFSWETEVGRDTATAASGRTATRRLDDLRASALLAEHRAAVHRLIGFEDAAVTKPIAGNTTLSQVVSSFSSRFRPDHQDVSARWSYQGTVVGGPNDGRKLKGTVVLTVKRAPPAEMIELAGGR